MSKNFEIFRTFMTTDDEQHNALYQAALVCSRVEGLKNMFHIFI